MRRRLFAAAGSVLLLVGLAGVGCTAVVEPGPGGPPGRGQEKVLVCHKGKKTLEVAAPALEAHLKHGDTRGRCR